MSLSNPKLLAEDDGEHDVHELLAALKDADLLQVSWPEEGVQKGFDVYIAPLCARPKTLALTVRSRREAFALREAKIAIDNGNHHGAYMAICALVAPGSSAIH